MIKRGLFVALLALAAVLAGGVRPAQALPLLQLDTSNGYYNGQTETNEALSFQFTLWAYLTPSQNMTAAEIADLLDDTYYIAAALTPVVETSQNLGAFTFNGQPVNATADMVYGVPPVETYWGNTAAEDSGDLSKHNIYSTYFKEFSFKFNTAQRAVAYNTCTDTNEKTNDCDDGAGDVYAPTPSPNGNMYYVGFTVDTWPLSQTHQVHFDLYSTKVGKNNDIDIKYFAPFSHDAESYHIPEPASLTLLGGGMAALAARYRRRHTRT